MVDVRDVRIVLPCKVTDLDINSVLCNPLKNYRAIKNNAGKYDAVSISSEYSRFLDFNKAASPNLMAIYSPVLDNRGRVKIRTNKTTIGVSDKFPDGRRGFVSPLICNRLLDYGEFKRLLVKFSLYTLNEYFGNVISIVSDEPTRLVVGGAGGNVCINFSPISKSISSNGYTKTFSTLDDLLKGISEYYSFLLKR